jgi:hypothetical protein
MEFASLEVFSEFVRLGDLAPDDVVYDAETKEWSSAQTHPVVLQMQMDAEESGAAESAPSANEPDADADVHSAPSMGELGLELAAAPSQMTPEQEAAAFVAKMQAERAADLDATGEVASIQGFTMDQGGTGLAEPMVEPVAPRRVEPRPAAIPTPAPAPVEYREPTRAPVPRYEAPVRPEPEEAPEPRRVRTGPGIARHAPFALLALALVAGAVYIGPDLLRSAGTTSEPEPDAFDSANPLPAEIADNEESVRGRAQERFLTATQAALRGLDPIPEVWLRGQYLAAPSDYANVRAVWEEYLTTVRDVRGGDRERYEVAYNRALDDARVDGAARTSRLAGALTDFGASQARRARHYDQVEAVATAALRGHDALVQAEGTISYEPASGAAVSGDPVIEAVGRSPEAQALLERVLDDILADLQGPGGPGESANVRDWVWTGFLSAVTSQ